ncbi:SMI1/KNR4 family protein [Chryseobacterium scophthalmum]|uniref:SMI1/KNR4 family protein n=1 Tax=Chryseobacterium scophthalmum TaxID=59733 RepID=UPI001AEC2E48|nr:SMI1/KNR4 family protein [Chryseobacterium scophthalmum]
MKEILIAISLLSIKSGEQNEFLTKFQIQNQWLGFDPAKNETITETEKKLNIILPEDYKNFIKITNGFSAPNSVEPTFMKIEDIDYLKNIEKEAIDAYQIPELENSILVAGKDEEQYFLLIPPKDKISKWKYWKFANWIPGKNEFENLEIYFKDVLDFCKNNTD